MPVRSGSGSYGSEPVIVRSSTPAHQPLTSHVPLTVVELVPGVTLAAEEFVTFVPFIVEEFVPFIVEAFVSRHLPVRTPSLLSLT